MEPGPMLLFSTQPPTIYHPIFHSAKHAGSWLWKTLKRLLPPSTIIHPYRLLSWLLSLLPPWLLSWLLAPGKRARMFVEFGPNILDR